MWVLVGPVGQKTDWLMSDLSMTHKCSLTGLTSDALKKFKVKSLILAQIERWRHA